MPTKSPPEMPLTEYAARRRKVRAQLKKSIGVIFAGRPLDHLHDDFRPHPHFEYLTGITDEPEAVLVLDPANPVEARREMLFLRPLNPEVEKWDGYRLEVSAKLREKTGFKAIFRTSHLPRFLGAAAKRAKSLACLHDFARYDQPISPDLELFGKLEARIPGLSIEDQTDLVPALRGSKSSHEVKMIEYAIDITAEGFNAAFKSVKPGMNEYELQESIEHAYRRRGARRTAFNTIAGSGINSTVLHYRANDQTIEDGALICIDSGAVWGGYSADITRTIPASGRFTARQREVYEVVLSAQEAAIKACKPGATLTEIDRAARAVITKAGYGDFFIHSIGHHLGLETHDHAPDGPLKAGAVVTIEPGIYLPEEAIGIRIEDDILITKGGSRNLSKQVPKTVREVEETMGRVTE